MSVIAIEAAAQFIQDRRGNHSGPGERHGFAANGVLSRKVAVAGDGITRPGRVLPVHFVAAEAAKDAVICVQVVIDPNVISQSVGGNGILELIVGTSRPTAGNSLPRDCGRNIGVGIESQKLYACWIEAGRGNDATADAAGLSGNG